MNAIKNRDTTKVMQVIEKEKKNKKSIHSHKRGDRVKNMVQMRFFFSVRNYIITNINNELFTEKKKKCNYL